MLNKNTHVIDREQINYLLSGATIEVEIIGKNGDSIILNLELDKKDLAYYNLVFSKGIENLRKENKK